MIPVFEPVIGPEEIEAVVAALKRGEISGSFGSSIPDFENAFATYCGRRYGVAVSSGTSALQLAVHAAGIGPGDEVLISASTNIATALAVLHNGATPVPVDSEPMTWNLDLDIVESLITSRTRAIIPVHLYGHPVDMDALGEIAQRHNLIVIEDAAEAHGALCRERIVGSFGDMACFSFYANKVITTGEGGMVVTDSAEYAERIRLLRNLAFTKPRFWHEVAGFNYRMTGLQAAMGLAQFGKINTIIADKRRVAHAYRDLLCDIEGLRLPVEAPWAYNVYWMYALVVEADFGMSRDELMSYLQNHGVDTRTFFCPMNQQPCVLEAVDRPLPPCPVADELWERGLYLPSSPSLQLDDLKFISQAIHSARLSVVA